MLFNVCVRNIVLCQPWPLKIKPNPVSNFGFLDDNENDQKYVNEEKETRGVTTRTLGVF